METTTNEVLDFEMDSPGSPSFASYFAEGSKPVNFNTASFRFYDLEALPNVFTTVVFAPDGYQGLPLNETIQAKTRSDKAAVYVFYLVDDNRGDPDRLDPRDINYENLRSRISRVFAKNPALVQIAPEIRTPILYDMRNRGVMEMFIHMLGGAYDGPTKASGYTDSGEDCLPLHFARPELGGDASITDPLRSRRNIPPYLFPVCDTHPDYSPGGDDPFIVGYNSYQYDTTMLALMFSDYYDEDSRGPNAPRQVTAHRMRKYNDEMFGPDYRKNMPSYLWSGGDSGSVTPAKTAHRIRSSMIKSGRQLDIARLNETVKKVALKRLLGQLGEQILESDRLTGNDTVIRDIDDFVDLITYNISDVIGTSLLFADNVYRGAFDLRASLLHRYRQTVFTRAEIPGQENYRVASVRNTDVRTDRLTVESFSAQFAARILAPYRDLDQIPNHIGELPVVSYRYPDAVVAKNTGRRRINVLTEARNFFYDRITDQGARSQFNDIYTYYRAIEGLNFNDRERVGSDIEDLVMNLRRELAGLGTGITDPAYHEAVMTFSTLFPASSVRAMDADEIEYGPGFTETQLTELVGVLSDHLADHPGTVTSLNALVLVCEALFDKALPADPGQDRPGGELLVWPPAGIIPAFTRGVDSISHIKEIALNPLNIMYFSDTDATPTTCFATFSTGGIHGAEMNQEKYLDISTTTRTRIEKFNSIIAQAQDQYHAALNDQENPDHKIAVDAEEFGRISSAEVIDTEAHETVTATEDFVDVLTGQRIPAEEAGAIAWFIRKKIRITVHDIDTGNTEEVHQQDIIRNGGIYKATNPHLRVLPKYVPNTKPLHRFTHVSSKVPATWPLGREHNANTLTKDYRYTSVDDVFHEDFTSYYPRLLTNMRAMANPDLGTNADGTPVDRYSDIFDDKERYGKLRKDPSLSPEERERISVMREGTKLILNSASGAADATHDTPIRANNRILTMRVIGQLFSWQIGQGQSLFGGKITSTNTDGLYCAGLDAETNQITLDELAGDIGVDIEPEPMTLVSKDANNRVELAVRDPERAVGDREILSASGGALAAYYGPSTRKSVSGAAIEDRGLVDYFRFIVDAAVIGTDIPVDPDHPELAGEVLDITQPMNRPLARRLVDNAFHGDDPATALRYAQVMMSSSPGVSSYLFTTPYGPDVNATEVADPALVNPTQHYNRVLLVDPEKFTLVSDRLTGYASPLVCMGSAKGREVSATAVADRVRKGEPMAQSMAAKKILAAAGEPVDSWIAGGGTPRDLVLMKFTGIDPTQPLTVFNASLNHFPDREALVTLVSALDTDAYIDKLVNNFNENWRNHPVDHSDNDGNDPAEMSVTA